MTAVGLGREANGVWATYADRGRAWAGRHRALVRRLRVAWAVWAWASLAVFVAGLVVVDSARPGLRPWLWAYYGVVQVFLVARTKTLSWRFVALVFGVGVVAAPLIGLIEVAVSGQIDADVHAGDGGVYVAGPVEESLKLAPLLALLVFARRRAQGFAVVDYLLVGYAAGFAFQAVEDAMRQIVAGQRSETATGLGSMNDFLLGDQATGEAIYGWGWLQGAAHLDLSPIIRTSEPAFFAGHAVPTALVAVGIGLATRLRWRLGPVIWLLPVALFAMVTVDHALYNEVANRPIIEMPDVEISEKMRERLDIELPSDHEADVPDRLQEAWRSWGRGRFERPLLTLLLIAGMVLDVRRLRRARTTVPPLPAIRSAGRIERAAEAVALSLRMSAAKAGALRRVVVGAIAESLRWLLSTVADVWHELVLSFLGAGAPVDQPEGWTYDERAGSWNHPLHGAARQDPSTGRWTFAATGTAPPRPPPTRRGPSRWLATLYYLRVNRQLGQQAEARADRRRRRTGWLGIWRGLAATSVVVVVVAGGVAVSAGVDGAAAHTMFLANLLEDLAEWWSSLSFGEQVLLIVGGAALLSFGFGWAFLPTLGYVSMASAVPEHGRGAADFIRDPEEATRRFFRELTPADALWYAGSEAAGRLVPKGSSLVRNRLRRNVDEIIESADDDARRALDPPRPRPRIERDGQWITPGTDPKVPRRSVSPFSRDYEDWVRTQAGGPHGQEFRYNEINFDAIDSHHLDGTPGDVLIDAKADYDQFIDPATGDWKWWFGDGPDPKQGLAGELADATRQVDAARGTPVEWRCAQESSAELLNNAFESDDNLNGKIKAVFVAPPEGMTPT